MKAVMDIWKNAPEDATHYNPSDFVELCKYYKLSGKEYVYFYNGRWESSGANKESLDECLIKRPEAQSVFTQAMADNGELPVVGMECIGTSSRGLVMTGWEKGSIIFSSPTYTIFKTSNNIEFCCNHLLGQDFKFKPIDQRTDKEKAIDEMMEHQKESISFRHLLSNAYDKWVGE